MDGCMKVCSKIPKSGYRIADILNVYKIISTRGFVEYRKFVKTLRLTGAEG